MTMSFSTKIFVGGIPQEVTEDDLREAVSVYGNVLHVYYARATDQNCRGWAFIIYEKIESAYKAIKCLHSKRIVPNSQWPLEVKFAESKQGNRSIVYKNTKSLHDADINKKKEWQLVKSDVSSYKYNVGKSQRGFYPNSSQTDVLPQEVNKKEMRLTVRHLTTNLFIFHVPAHWSDRDLYDYFAPFGHIVSAHVQKDANGRNKGYGFVNYTNPVSASRAIKKMNGFHVAGKYLKVQLKKGDDKYALMGYMLQRNMVQHNIIQNNTVENTMMHNNRLQNIVMQNNIMPENIIPDNNVPDNIMSDNNMSNSIMSNNTMQNNTVQNNIMQNNIMQNNIMQNNTMQNNIMQNNGMQNSSMHTPHVMVHQPTLIPGQYFFFTHPLMVTPGQSNPVLLFTFTPMDTKN